MSGVEVAIGIVGGLMQLQQGREAERSARRAAAEEERLAREEAAMNERSMMEEKRREQKRMDEESAETRARAAATGARTEGSLDIFMGAQEDERQRQLDWMDRAIASQSRYTTQAGRNRANQLRSAGKAKRWDSYSDALSSFGSAYGAGKSAGWW